MTRPTDPLDLTGADIARWLTAAVLVFGSGGAGVIALQSLPAAVVSGATDIAGFEVVFETAAISPEIPQNEADESIEPAPIEGLGAPETETEFQEQPAPELVEQEDISESAPEAPELEPEPEAEAEPEPEPEPDVIPDVSPVQEPTPETVAEAEEKLDLTPEPEPTEPNDAELEEREAQPRTVTVAMPMTRPSDLAAPRPRPAPSSTPSGSASAPRAAAIAQAAAAPAIAAGPSAAQEATWQNRLVAHLDRKKTYPREAQRARLTGTVVMRFTLDPNGRLVSASIAQSSGVPALDEAAVALVHKASPYPTPPAGISAGKLTLRVPIAYNLR